MIGKHIDNRFYPEQCSQGFYYFNDEAKEGEVVYIPEHAFDDDEDFLEEGSEDLYTMEDIRKSAKQRLSDIEGYDELDEARKEQELDRLVKSFLEWCGDGEAWTYPETYFDERDIEF